MNRWLLCLTCLSMMGCPNQPSGSNCTSDSECNGGKCQDSVCVAATSCTADAQCGKCQACRDNKCVMQAATEDVKDECAEGDCTTGFCNGTGGCGFKSAATVCRAAAGPCDAEEKCTGLSAECPVDGYKPSTEACRNASAPCEDNAKCSGNSAACPANPFKPATEVCRDATDLCEEAARCSGNGATCPATNPLKPGTVVCRPAADACDVEEKCSGLAKACPTDAKQPINHPCGNPASCSGQTFSEAQSCDGLGSCRTAATSSCEPYVCGASACKTSCATDADCTTGLCDLNKRECAPSVKTVNCSATNSQLQADITNSCVRGSTCYLRIISGFCGAVRVQNKDVYLTSAPGSKIQPSTLGTAVSVFEDSGESTTVTLSGVTVSGASGDGVNAQGLGSGAGAGNPTVNIFTASITGNSGAGVSASSATVFINGGSITGNSGAGVSASSATVFINGGSITGNSGAGVKLIESPFSITNTVIAANGTTMTATDAAGVKIDFSSALTPTTFRFNTVANNGNTSSQSGIRCVSNQFDILDSIVWGNKGSQLATCSGLLTGSHVQGSPQSQSCGSSADPLLTGDYHLAPNSPCIDKVACDLSITKDIDGDARPQTKAGTPASTPCDVGADEVTP